MTEPHDDYEYDDSEQDDGGEPEFDCPRFWTLEGWFCPAQGSEDCDWECPYS